MQVTRDDTGAATVHLEHSEVRELLGAFALSMGAYGILQNFMTADQKGWSLPSIAFISRLGVLLAADEQFMPDDTNGGPESEPAAHSLE